MISLKRKTIDQQVLIYAGTHDFRAWQFKHAARQVSIIKSTSASLEPGLRLDQLPEQDLTDKLSELVKPLATSNRDVCLVLGSESVFTFRLDLPELEKEDLMSFIELEADQHLPFPVSEFYLTSDNDLKNASGETLILAIQKSRIEPIAKGLKSVGFNLANVTLDVAGTLDPDLTNQRGESLLLIGEEHCTFAMHSRGTLIGIRQFPYPATGVEIQSMVRDIRISIAQYPTDIQGDLRRIRTVILPRTTTDTSKAAPIAFEPSAATGLNFLKPVNSDDLFQSIAESLFEKHAPPLEFLPPKPNRFEKIVERFNSRKNFWVGAAVAGVVILTGLAFILQDRTLKNLDSRWSGIASKVTELEKIQQQIREFRPWFDDDIPSLSALKSVFEAFPEYGDVWLKQLIVKEGSRIKCSGFASSRNAILDVRKSLMETPGISDLQELASSGDNPISFSFQFTWNEQVASSAAQNNNDGQNNGNSEQNNQEQKESTDEN